MTIPPKKKKCKPNYKAEGATGCGKEVYERTYGLGIYGYENLKDLAIAILRFEKQKQESESIISEV